MMTNLKRWCLALGLGAMPCLAQADVLVGTNGERFVGQVIEETPETVVFESELGGRLTLPRARVREIQKTPSTTTVEPAPASPLAPAPSVTQWVPPGVGTDGFDWIELNTGEWLKGWLKYIQERDIQFESDKLDEFTFEWKDIRQIYTGQPMYVKFDGQPQFYGAIVVSNQMVRVNGPEPISLSRDQLTGLTPGGQTERSFWAGRASVGLNFQSGNTEQTSLNVSAELARRTPSTVLRVNYLASYSEVSGTQNANNQRVNSSFDVLLSRNFFVRPMMFEFYRDPLANISSRSTVGTGLGYYIFNRDRLKWLVAGGPAYQYTRFDTVEAGESDHASTPAAVLETSFQGDITRRIKFFQTFSITLTDQDSGRYSHHSVSTLEFEVKHHLDLNISFVWDFLQNPTAESNGTVPLRTDARLTLGLGVKF